MRILEPTDANIRDAAEALRRGELVGIPTETVYGIAAHAFSEVSVQRTFEVKARPADNPLIVHLASVDQVPDVAGSWPDIAQTLADRFWPGPLTVVVPRHPSLPRVVTGGLDTVAIRVPLHPVAQMLLAESGLPLSAPSANRFMALSPTRAEDIDPAVGDRLFCVLDGGPCRYGIESTVVDCSRSEPRILRPGGISRAQIERCIGPLAASEPQTERRSPGQYARHYAPRTPVKIVERLGPEDAGITFGDPENERQIQLPDDPKAYASKLYASLKKLDKVELFKLCVEAPPDGPEWEAVWDRLRKASG